MSSETEIRIAEDEPNTKRSQEMARNAEQRLEEQPQVQVQGDTLEDFERGDGRLPFILNMAELKLLGIAGVGFFLDAYDLFIINQVSVMLQWRLYDGNPLPPSLEGFMKAGANIGAVIGQFAFGYLADALGRKAIYGKELMLIIFAEIMTISCPTNLLSPTHVLLWIAGWRIILGIGIGGDYPMSSTITSDRAKVRKRGVLLGYVFANQGWGSFVGSLVTMIVLLIYRGAIEHKGSKIDGVWRIVVGFSLIPAFGTLYQRLTLPESTRYKKSQAIREEEDVDEIELEKRKQTEAEAEASESGEETGAVRPIPTPRPTPRRTDALAINRMIQPPKKSHLREFAEYFSEWQHLKNLIATSVCWFLLDVAFYGINLNQSVVLQQIHFNGEDEPEWQSLFHIATGNLIITALGFVPGYYVTILTIEYLGRKWIQIQGFLFAALFLAVLAARFNELSIPAFVTLFALLQFFFNFGANATCYIYPAEVFPTRIRASAHGLSAASGKAGAIVSSLAFNQLSKSIGIPNVMWIFVGCCLVGAVMTILLPEVKGRDPDLIDAEERRAARAGHSD